MHSSPLIPSTMSSRPSSPHTIFSTTRPHSPNSTLASSPPPFSIHCDPSTRKPKGKPTVTPRTFTRFFTPRSPAWRRKTVGASRKALQEITQGASNGRSAKRMKLAKDTVVLEGEDDLGFRDIGVPLKEHGLSIKKQGNDTNKHKDHTKGHVPDSDLTLSTRGRTQLLLEESEESGEEEEEKVAPRHVIRSNYRGQLGAVLRRQLGEPWQPGRRGRVRITAGQYLEYL